MRAVGYSRCLLCSALAVLMLTALMLAVLPAVSLALEPGVHADPGSPAEKQYVLPLSQARGTGGETSSHSSSPRLFGAGIKPPGGGGDTGAGSRSGTQAGSGAPAGKGKHRHRVHVLDDPSTGRLENLSELQEHPDFSCSVGSVSDAALLQELVTDADVVIHLAAAVGVRLVVESPVRAIETNVHCTEVVLDHADRHRKPVLLASTSEVYGKSEALPFKEDGDLRLGATFKARWAYACSKAIDEFLAMAYWRERDLPIAVVRLFNTVGPRQTGSYGMVVPRLVGQALAGEPLTVYGDGRQTRCFCHVGDVAQALVGLLEHPKAWGEVFNVGATREVSILELAQRVLL